MTITITVTNKEMTITQVGETFTEGAFQVVAKEQVIFSAPTNKACVMYVAKNKEIEIELASENAIVIPEGQRYVVLNDMNECEGLEVGMLISTGKRKRTIARIYEVFTDANIKKIWVDTVSPSGIVTTVGIDSTKKYEVLSK